jgi:hypothetical protein
MKPMTHSKTPRRLALALLALALGTGAAAAQAPVQNTGDWLPVTIVYNSDVVGKIDPCG